MKPEMIIFGSMKKVIVWALIPVFLLYSCDEIPIELENLPDQTFVPELEEVSGLISSLPVSVEQMTEVFSAVSSSSINGYDEEYTMRDLFLTPGAGVGDEASATKAEVYKRPMRDLIEEYLGEKMKTKAGAVDEKSVKEYIESLISSDIQIYWPYSEDWDGQTLPVITFDPCSEASANIGYRICVDEEGNRYTEEVIVDEKLAESSPVWVVNRNDDGNFKTLEMRRKEDPQWGQGGEVLVKSGDDQDYKMLVLKEFCALRNFDSWFGGASEFLVKCGAVEGFTASTEAEMRVYQPTITDFMISVKRKNVGKTLPFNAVLISDWSDQLEKFAFLVIEDDGGTVTSWKCSAVVKVNSKSYGFEMEIPYRDRDDIVWRGMLSTSYFQKYDGEVGHFGDVDLTFEIR